MDDILNSTTTTEVIDQGQRFAAASLFCLTSVLGVVGNSLVIAAVVVSRQLQTTTNAFVVTLSITDLLNCLFLPVQVLSLLMTASSPSFLWVCTIVAVCLYLFLGTSVATLALVAVNRFYAITKTRQEYTKLYTKRNIAVMLIAVYGTMSLGTIVFAATGLATFGPYEGLCSLAAGDSFTYLAGLWLVVSLMTIVICYTKIYIHVRNHLRRVAAMDNREPVEVPQREAPANQHSPTTRAPGRMEKPGFAQRQRDLEAKITMNMLIIIVLFFLCVSPSILTLILPGDQHADAIIIAILSLNSCLNPLVYAWKHPVFRQVFRCILGRKLSDIREPSQFLHSIHRN